MGQVPDVRQAVTMDLKKPGNALFILGTTRNELGGSHWGLIHSDAGGNPPVVEPAQAKALFQALHSAIRGGLVRSCHDLSEGGLAAALAEMAFAGGLGANVSLRDVPCEDDAASDAVLLFSETPSRFIVEVAPEAERQFMHGMGDLPIGRLGETADVLDGSRECRLVIDGLDFKGVVDVEVSRLKAAWQAPLDWS